MNLIGCKGIECENLSNEFILEAKTDMEKRERVIVNYYPMVFKIVKKYDVRNIPSVDWEDLTSIGLESINKAIDRYSPEKGSSFNTYCYTTIHGYIASEIRKFSFVTNGDLNQNIVSIQKMESMGISFADLVPDDKDYEAIALTSKPTPKKGWALVKRNLTKDQRKILTELYIKEKTVKEMAISRGVTQQTMHSRLRTINKRLREKVGKERLYKGFGIEMDNNIY